ncbi:HAD family hydrolase [Arthrobacter sp. I2-34]|uniref:HAD family hydrolase n=1 Tax=Arthrobacter hankyongi TaxID=2904801 RepID=A0ABS9L326_9MICC|nr:HAD family hydrolase [Arthrobacter hankyongi]MCG2620973.1 HAD family hydrolase [Arthrobacter hankyongi]
MAQQENRRRGVLFDVDGTLVDSNYLHVLAWWQAFRRLGHDVPMAAIHRAVGMGGKRLIAHLLGQDRAAEQGQALDDTHAAVFSTYWPALRPLDGAADLLQHCAEAGLAAVLASSARQDELDVLRAVVGADNWITAATSSADAEQSKPAPDILAAALEAGGIQADGAVFVGDAVWDIFAAADLDIPVIGLTSGGTSEAELRAAGAAEIYTGPRDLLASFDTSLLGGLIRD